MTYAIAGARNSKNGWMLERETKSMRRNTTCSSRYWKGRPCSSQCSCGIVNYENSCNDRKRTDDEAFHKPSSDLGQPALRGLTPTQQDVELTVKRRVALELEMYKLTRVPRLRNGDKKRTSSRNETFCLNVWSGNATMS